MDELDPTARLLLVAVLCRMQREYSLKPRDIDQLFCIVAAVVVADEDVVKIAEVDRVGYLARALEGTFPKDHAVWGFLRWRRPGID